jgi:hypothetical protein
MKREITTIHQISLSMGLNPNATNVLEKMKKAPNTTIEAISELL